ncbi:MAG: valine--tRNA ligase [Ardenticatenaceae bacterium]|nr:valine--tRNA ligase [Ardenticatenaceae bacterium]MCB8987173.1 valine--tRNA ligase [Ardenticatenaceae bacterium]
MSLPKRYNPTTAEPARRDQWLADGIYHFNPDQSGVIYSIDTPPPTVSGHLHLGHVYSYSHTDFMARFMRMNGRNVFYPMGFDDNGLPTERLVERRENITAALAGRQAFIERCLAVSEEAEKDYRELWQRLGLSIDWRYSYRSIDAHSRKLAQWSFIDLYHKGLAYQQEAPAIWCPECQTAIAQAELNDLEREAAFYTLAFGLDDDRTLEIATTRPELLPACVAVFVHPEDGRFTHLIGRQAMVPLFGQRVSILADPEADPAKGTGAVMCCTFGDQTDVAWWHIHRLPLIEAIGRDGRLTTAAAAFAGHTVPEARTAIVAALRQAGQLLGSRPIAQAVRVHERCDTPVEYIVARQWFIRVLDFKEELLAAGEQISWQPPHMAARYRQWVENLAWDWGISRQRTFGVPFPAWTCAACGQIVLADEADLPVDPVESEPPRPCPACNGRSFLPERDVMDTWATSSLSPQIVGQFFADPALYAQVYPFALRPQAHEIIRTWAFYTIVKSHHHWGKVPFETIAISGWGLAPEGTGKISKSRGGGPVAPLAMIEQYSADAVRYWAASTGFGRDAVISEEKVQAGAKLVTKLWNVARFSQRFLETAETGKPESPHAFTLGDRWLLARTQQLIERVTALMWDYDYATAKSETETFFWSVLADNYLEMAKQRLYDGGPSGDGARFALGEALLATLKLFAPFLPFVTEQIYEGLFAAAGDSIHRAAWPVGDESWRDDTAVAHGNLLIDIATAVRRYKSEHNLSLGAELPPLILAAQDADLVQALAAAASDLQSITRAQTVRVEAALAGRVVGEVDNGRITLCLGTPDTQPSN